MPTCQAGIAKNARANFLFPHRFPPESGSIQPGCFAFTITTNGWTGILQIVQEFFKRGSTILLMVRYLLQFF